MFLKFLLTVAVFSSPSLAALASPRAPGHNLFSRQQGLSGGNTSALPPGWSQFANCFEDCEDCGPTAPLLLGPSFLDPIGMTIESCVGFCDQQDAWIAGLYGPQCRCGNIFNPATGFDSDDEETCLFSGETCPGNEYEACGAPSQGRMNVWLKGDTCEVFPGGATVTSGPWRLAYFYNDTVGARALPHNAVDLHPSLKRGNLTVEACVSACGAAGFLLAGVEFADECYCGNDLENNSQPISCDLFFSSYHVMPCKGDPTEPCGGPGLISVYTLPGSDLVPLIPFDSIFDGFCPDCAADGGNV